MNSKLTVSDLRFPRFAIFGSDLTRARQKIEDERPKKEQILTEMRQDANSAIMQRRKERSDT